MIPFPRMLILSLFIPLFACGAFANSSDEFASAQFRSFTERQHVISDCIVKEIVPQEDGWITNSFRMRWQPNAAFVQRFKGPSPEPSLWGQEKYDGDIEAIWGDSLWVMTQTSYLEETLDPLRKRVFAPSGTGHLSYAIPGPLSRAIHGGVWGCAPGTMRWQGDQFTRTNGTARKVSVLGEMLLDREQRPAGLRMTYTQADGTKTHESIRYTAFDLPSLPFVPSRIEYYNDGQNRPKLIVIVERLVLAQTELPASAFEPDNYFHGKIVSYKLNRSRTQGSMPPNGRTVTGRVNLNPQPAVGVSVTWDNENKLFMEVPNLPSGSASNKELRKWFRSSDVRWALQHSYPVKIGEGGYFRIEDVAPGNYILSIRAKELGTDNAPIDGTINEQIVVTAKGADEGKPFALPEMTLVLPRTLQIGDVAPEIDADGIDGSSISLSRFRGKFLLVDFWARWCGPCIASIPELKRFKDSLKANSHFELLSVSLDARKEDALLIIQKEHMDWPQVFLASPTQRQTPARYGVTGIPALFLIGPDGKIVAQSESLSDMRAQVENVLAQAATRSSQ